MFIRGCKLSGLALFCVLLSVSLAQAQNATALQARHAALRAQLADNQFQRPLYIESSEQAGELQGDIYAVIDQPYAVVSPALQGMQHWCDILILHLNVKSCRAGTSPAGDALSLNIGRKFDQPLTDGYQFEFLYTVNAARPDYMQTVLSAAAGPLGTKHYRIVLEVVQLDTGHSFLHLSYSYVSSMTARLAMQSYLKTIGRDKVGFSIVGKQANGQPIYIDNLRGVIERNTMRYYLAVEAYLGALAVPAAQQLDQRLNAWHSSAERYPLQLHELDRAEYLEMKHKEIKRQQALR